MFDLTVNPHMVYGGDGDSNKNTGEKSKPEVKQYKTEFHRAYADFVTDLQLFRDNYPLTTLISIVVFGIFGFFNVLSIFSPSALIAGVILLGLSTCLALSIGKDPNGFKDVVFKSLSQVKNFAFNGGKEEAKA